jgi:hypothetical protein
MRTGAAYFCNLNPIEFESNFWTNGINEKFFSPCIWGCILAKNAAPKKKKAKKKPRAAFVLILIATSASAPAPGKESKDTGFAHNIHYVTEAEAEVAISIKKNAARGFFLIFGAAFLAKMRPQRLGPKKFSLIPLVKNFPLEFDWIDVTNICGPCSHILDVIKVTN